VSSPAAAASSIVPAAEPETMPRWRTSIGPPGVDEHRLAQRALEEVGEVAQRERRGEDAGHADGAAAPGPERAHLVEPDELGEAPVVAHLGVRVEGEVRGVEADVVLQEEREPLAVRARHGQGRAPEEAVVGDQHVGAGLGRLFHGGEAAIDGDGDLLDVGGAFDLEPVERRIVGERREVEVAIEPGDEIVALHASRVRQRRRSVREPGVRPLAATWRRCTSA
jgi:hypothetical protein